jgi:hypothetical protein
MNDTLRDDINKRLTLNWLIQGAAQHAGMTFHHLIRDELDALDPRLLLLYDKYALINLLQYWQIDATILFGRPSRFWRRARSKHNHPFFAHPLLSKFGGMLAAAGRQRARERAKEKGVTNNPILFSFQVLYLISRLRMIEAPHRARLIELARESASTIWGIPIHRLDGQITDQVFPGNRIRAKTTRAVLMQAGIVGYGGVEQRGDSLIVTGRGTNWQLLTKELVKGTAELICLHGLNRLSDEIYAAVMDATDRLEYEPWMLQTGGELWRRLLGLIPVGRPVARVLMHLARLPPKSLETLIAAVIEQPERARQLLAALEGEAEA